MLTESFDIKLLWKGKRESGDVEMKIYVYPQNNIQRDTKSRTEPNNNNGDNKNII